MAPQAHIPTSANILGTIGTICWCVQLVPQIFRNYRTKSTLGLPAAMMFLWSSSGVPFGIYAIVQRFNIPLIVQPQCFCLLCLVSWGQCLYYGRKWKAVPTLAVCIALLCIFGGIQLGLVLAIRPLYDHHNVDWPVRTIGIIAFIVMISGYFPIPLELIKRRGRVVGVDFVFLAIDWFGAFFSLMSLVAQNEFDVLFGTLYALCASIEMIMVTSHLIWMLRTRGVRKRAKQVGVTFDEFPEAVDWQAKGFDLEVWCRKFMLQKKSKTKDEEAGQQETEEVQLET